MKKFFWLCIILLVITSGGTANAQQVSIIKFDDLAKMMSVQNDTTYIFNFFATWCQPCVEEFPIFEPFMKHREHDKVRLVFVSLDFKKDYKTRLLPFLKKNHVKNEVVLLDETDYNSWIDKVDSTWDGGLPATLVFNNGKHFQKMFAQEFTYDMLVSAIERFLHLG